MPGMAKPEPKPVADGNVYAVAPKGDAELKSPGTQLSPVELEVLVLVDGFSSVAKIALRAPNLSRAEVDASLQKLLAGKMIVDAGGSEPDAMSSGFSTISVPLGFFSNLGVDTSEADGGSIILKQKGYYVRIARIEGHGERAKGWKPTILVVDDDRDLQKLIRTYFTMEGFQSRAAFKRDDILAALRLHPMPDLVLLDVQLPDANGFEILDRMRQHPVLKNMPVIMLTAEATRESVLRGLRGGADGYITKPFQAEMVVRAVKAVLGLATSQELKALPFDP
jgi:two-component system, OmpR family, response regulator